MHNATTQMLENAPFFSYSGTLNGLFLILATGKVSSSAALKEQGLPFTRLTDPMRSFEGDEANYLFFETPQLRGKLHNTGMLNDKELMSRAGFTLLIAGKDLMPQTDCVAFEEGIVLSRQDHGPIEIGIDDMDIRICVGENRRAEIDSWLRSIPEEHPIHHRAEALVYKSVDEWQRLFQTSDSETDESIMSKMKSLVSSISWKPLSMAKANKSIDWYDKSEETLRVHNRDVEAYYSITLITEKPKFQPPYSDSDLLARMREIPTPDFRRSISDELVHAVSNKTDIPLIMQWYKDGKLDEMLEIMERYIDSQPGGKPLREANAHALKHAWLNIANYSTRLSPQDSYGLRRLSDGWAVMAQLGHDEYPALLNQWIQTTQEPLPTSWKCAMGDPLELSEPIDEQTLLEAIYRGELPEDVFVWTAGMSMWESAQTCAELEKGRQWLATLPEFKSN